MSVFFFVGKISILGVTSITWHYIMFSWRSLLLVVSFINSVEGGLFCCNISVAVIYFRIITNFNCSY